ncbi:hypothetical protein [Crenothrix polyspora]|jgi:hypothetical protein|uniref:Uncharacterized protein n=1 Tax=Crenothrix polyspora TaxID=360316 RepID=A0A1R4H027_9GAMM|nr:hypothetical protein [Crenothrix polyspora]SJM89608.1 conserved hypothetical protein [Crenothrix polyspora]
MSNEENANNTEENATIAEESVNTVEEVVSKSAEKIEDLTSKKTEDSVKNAGGNLLSSVLSLKESNPKLFYGLLAVVAIPVVVIMMSGGGSDAVTGPKIKDLVSGQKYTLKSSNSYDPSATVRLVAVPGALSAYDDSEEADRNGACQHLAQGTSVTALDFSAAYGQAKQFVKVQVEDGPCKGTTAWALGIDVQ